MPNKPTHIIAGAGAGVLAVNFWPLEDDNIKSGEYLTGAVIGGIIGGMLPDIIDPPRSPHHRSIGHSMTGNSIGLGALIANIDTIDQALSERIKEAEENENYVLAGFYRFVSGLIKGFIAGQASHLLLDLTTPKRLPMIM